MKLITKYRGNDDGNVSVILVVCLFMLLTAVGAAIDTSNLVKEKTKSQGALDAATLAAVVVYSQAVSDGDNKLTAHKKAKLAATETMLANYSDHTAKKLTINITDDSQSVTAEGYTQTDIDLYIMGIFQGKKKSSVSTASVAIGPRIEYNEIHFVIDTSASMGVGTTDRDIRLMVDRISCAFACHTPPGADAFPDTVDYMRDSGVELRIDTVKNNIASGIDGFSNSYGTKFAVHAFSNDLMTIIEPTSDLEEAKLGLQSLDLSDKIGQGGTNFHKTFSDLTTKIGISGQGNSISTPKKTVIFVTDGTSSNVQYILEPVGEDDVIADPEFQFYSDVYNGTDAWALQGFDPQPCRSFKFSTKAKVVVLALDYTIPSIGDDGDTRFETIDKYLKRDIERNLKGCASNPADFYVAGSKSKIEAKLANIFESLPRSEIRTSR